jgi:hypothetical protein
MSRINSNPFIGLGRASASAILTDYDLRCLDINGDLLEGDILLVRGSSLTGWAHLVDHRECFSGEFIANTTVLTRGDVAAVTEARR